MWKTFSDGLGNGGLYRVGVFESYARESNAVRFYRVESLGRAHLASRKSTRMVEIQIVERLIDDIVDSSSDRRITNRVPKIHKMIRSAAIGSLTERKPNVEQTIEKVPREGKARSSCVLKNRTVVSYIIPIDYSSLKNERSSDVIEISSRRI